MFDRMLRNMPQGARARVENTIDGIGLMMSVRNPQVALDIAPSALRGLVLRQGKMQKHVDMYSAHPVHFDLSYQGDHPEMYDLYRRAVANQWDADQQVDWSIDVDPLNPERPVVGDLVGMDHIQQSLNMRLTPTEQARLKADIGAWVLSQFLHGEQGALYASAQVTESVRWLDGKLYGATQVMDEGRHVETFFRYLDTKLNKLYPVNDNLFVIIDDLMTDSRWDIKFLGMQIMVEGLALGAFSTIYSETREPLLKEALRYIIQDEARHVHYGVLALREHIQSELSAAERREREDWAFEVALLMRNRFLMHEVYEEWFGDRIRRRDWDRMIQTAPGMQQFRKIMFSRLMPNLDYIGLLSDRTKIHYEKAGLMQFASGKNATQLTGEDLLAQNDTISREAARIAS